MGEKQNKIDEKDKMEHETLYEEIHKIDDLLETHANIMIALISAMLIFLFTLKSAIAIDVLSFVGFFVSLEFFLHTYRLKQIAKSATERVKKIEEKIGIHTTRPKTRVPSGSTLICCISLLFMSLWLILIVLFNLGAISM